MKVEKKNIRAGCLAGEFEICTVHEDLTDAVLKELESIGVQKVTVWRDWSEYVTITSYRSPVARHARRHLRVNRIIQ